jgi:hypothetical protein
MEPLREADMVLDACGRRQPPSGYRWVDLPAVLPFNWSKFEAVAPVTPAQGRIANNSRANFICRGVMIQSPVGVRIRWPGGRYLSQGPTWVNLPAPGNPSATGGSIIALDTEQVIERGAKIAIEMSGGTAGLVNIQFWGVLRYLLMSGKNGGAGDGSAPVMMPDPIDELEARSRFRCGPPQNIMAPEWYLGNQCTRETPDGFEDEAFTFLSGGITVPVGGQNFNNAVIVPGGDDVIVRRYRAITDYTALMPASSTVPVFSLRLPSGYSVTGGDLVPTPNLFWIPMFPSIRLHPGDRMIIDMGDMQPLGSGSVTTTFEFEAVKRRKLLP